MGIVRDSDHSNGSPTTTRTGTRVRDAADADGHGGYDPDRIGGCVPLLGSGTCPRQSQRSSTTIEKPRWTDSDPEWDAYD